MPDIILSSDNIGDVVSFATRAPGILGSGYTRATVLSFLDADDVTRFFDPMSMHQAVYPSLPPSVPNDPLRYPYVKLKLENGTVAALGLPWIDPATVNIHNEIAVDFRVSGIVATDVSRLRDALVAAGAINIEITPVA